MSMKKSSSEKLMASFTFTSHMHGKSPKRFTQRAFESKFCIRFLFSFCRLRVLPIFCLLNHLDNATKLVQTIFVESTSSINSHFFCIIVQTISVLFPNILCTFFVVIESKFRGHARLFTIGNIIVTVI